jgi:hypothetical protein
MEPAILLGNDAGSVLSAMLQHGQRVVNALIDRFLPDDADDSAHASLPAFVFEDP